MNEPDEVLSPMNTITGSDGRSSSSSSAEPGPAPRMLPEKASNRGCTGPPVEVQLQRHLRADLEVSQASGGSPRRSRRGLRHHEEEVVAAGVGLSVDQQRLPPAPIRALPAVPGASRCGPAADIRLDYAEGLGHAAILRLGHLLYRPPRLGVPRRGRPHGPLFVRFYTTDAERPRAAVLAWCVSSMSHRSRLRIEELAVDEAMRPDSQIQDSCRATSGSVNAYVSCSVISLSLTPRQDDVRLEERIRN